ncbi:hypothetical protein G4177_35060 [Corallococcus sp. ZKHCc1 1396]|uniref:DUF4129 domain-containing protein n=1 Tax=Corallococcus soli TaxID=2710757 RepID=A0ABR9PZP9_9BACT|nr:hypothetical protein [Corallococcus soli]MBE4753383.1 hypothetical protein [Corallococcus soli]
MSREENNRYLKNLVTQQVGKNTLLGRLGIDQPLRKLVVVWAVLLGLFWLLDSIFATTTSSVRHPTKLGLEVPGFLSDLPPSMLLGLGLFLPIIGVMLALQLRKGHKTRQKEALALQQPEPDAYLQLMDELIPPDSAFPDAATYRAQNRAVAMTLYGKAHQARQELDAVPWKGKPPLLQSVERVTEALVCLLCTDDAARGLALAKEAVDMSQVSPHWSGASKWRVFHEVVLLVAEVLTGTATPTGVKALELHHQQTRLLVLRLVSAWGLWVAATQTKDVARAERMRAFLQQHAPHCAPLHRLPGPPPPERAAG